MNLGYACELRFAVGWNAGRADECMATRVDIVGRNNHTLPMRRRNESHRKIIHALRAVRRPQSSVSSTSFTMLPMPAVSTCAPIACGVDVDDVVVVDRHRRRRRHPRRRLVASTHRLTSTLSWSTTSSPSSQSSTSFTMLRSLRPMWRVCGCRRAPSALSLIHI